MAVATAMAAPVRLTSSVGLISMLEDEDPLIKAHALSKLNGVVADFWAEISEALPDIEALYEDGDFPQRKLAALVASKVYYFLGELGDALTFALGARELFDVDEGSEYVRAVQFNLSLGSLLRLPAPHLTLPLQRLSARHPLSATAPS